MRRVLTGDAALRREERLQKREDRLTNKTSDLRAQIASLTAENERLRKVMRLLKEDTREHHEDWIEYGCDQKDAIRFVGDVCGILRAALQPKEESSE